VGTTTSAGYGHTVGHTIAFAYLPAELAERDRFEIEAYGVGWQAWRGRRSLYDPKGLRLKM
jgi:4-methylaminobutanoate oxidase (formaldehyde-forming)